MGTPWYAKSIVTSSFLSHVLPGRRDVHRNMPDALRRALDKPHHWEKPSKKFKRRKAR